MHRCGLIGLCKLNYPHGSIGLCKLNYLRVLEHPYKLKSTHLDILMILLWSCLYVRTMLHAKETDLPFRPDDLELMMRDLSDSAPAQRRAHPCIRPHHHRRRHHVRHAQKHQVVAARDSDETMYDVPTGASEKSCITEMDSSRHLYEQFSL